MHLARLQCQFAEATVASSPVYHLSDPDIGKLSKAAIKVQPLLYRNLRTHARNAELNAINAIATTSGFHSAAHIGSKSTVAQESAIVMFSWCRNRHYSLSSRASTFKNNTAGHSPAKHHRLQRLSGPSMLFSVALMFSALTTTQSLDCCSIHRARQPAV